MWILKLIYHLEESMQIENEKRYIKQGRRLNDLIFQLHKNQYLNTDNTYKTDTDRRELPEKL